MGSQAVSLAKACGYTSAGEHTIAPTQLERHVLELLIVFVGE
jgi:hypothetical protein